jgi:predicted nuclease with TOPRIM domain
MLLVMTSGLPAQTLTEVLQNLENSLETLERGYTLVNSGLKTLREQQTQLSAELDTLETESTELERRLTSLEQSWSEQKQATDALTAAFNSEIDRLNSELWVYRIGGAVLAGLVVWSFFR